MRVRNADELDVRGLHANGGKLRLERFCAAPVNVRNRIVRGEPAIRHRGYRIGDARVPQKIISRVEDQKAAIRNVDWFSDVYADRPSRFIWRVPLSSVTHLHFV